MAVSPFFFDVPVIDSLQFTTASTLGAAAPLSTGLYYGSKYTAVIGVNDSTVAILATIGWQRGGGTFIPLGSKSIGASAGLANNTPAVAMLDPGTILGTPFDNDGNPYIFLQSTADNLSIKLSSAVAIPAGRTLSFTAIGAGDSS